MSLACERARGNKLITGRGVVGDYYNIQSMLPTKLPTSTLAIRTDFLKMDGNDSRYSLSDDIENMVSNAAASVQSLSLISHQ
jgi:hypothetical protein